MDAREGDEQLKRLRRWRTRPEPDLSLGFLEQRLKRVRKDVDRLGEAASVWREQVPPELVDRTRLEGLHRGTLKVGVDSAGALYELDRLLRAGLETRILRACRRGGVSRIRLVRTASIEQRPASGG
jgi:hypothetical protein